MIRYYITFILFFLNVSTIALADEFSQSTIASYPQELSRAVKSIEQLPEVRQLLAKIQEAGCISIELGTQDTGDFHALWVANRRTIVVNPTQLKNEGSLICTILFEMHNAYTNTQFMSLVNQAIEGEISKEKYVERVERMEHANALSTCRMLEKGVNLGIFPKTATWSIFSNFDNHYMIQQIHGHSQWLANSYESLSPLQGQNFRGTISGLAQMNTQDKKDMLRYISVKHDLESNDIEQKWRGAILLQLEYTKLDGCAKGTFRGDCSRSARSAKLLHDVLKNHQFYRLLASA